jgi:hypothetical protein
MGEQPLEMDRLIEELRWVIRISPGLAQDRAVTGACERIG